MESFFTAAESALRTLFSKPQGSTVSSLLPSHLKTAELRTGYGELTESEKRKSISLMRINHVGEVCAQALYTGQALSSRNPKLKEHYKQACLEETAHLAWTLERVTDLNGRVSLLNPFWYLGSFVLGVVAGRMSDGISLGFVTETELQVGRHLESHLAQISESDIVSRCVLTKMYQDEMQHASDAKELGALELPNVVKKWMKFNSTVMVVVAYYV